MASAAAERGAGNGAGQVPTSDQPQVKVRYKGLLTVTIMTATVMQVLDTTIANVALPHMQASLGATQETITWVLTSYILASAVAIPITGWLADRIGVRQLLIAAAALFTIASMLCGIASNIEEMVLFRLLQGVGGAFIAPLAQSVMMDINKPSEQGKAMSVYGMGIMVGPILGPIIGGWITESIDWRWCFYVNVPVGIVCLAGLWFLMPDEPKTKRPFDITGFALLAVALSALQLMLDRGQHQDWFSSREIWIEAGIAFSAFWMFVVHNFTARTALFPPHMLADRNLLGGIGFMFVLGMVMLAAMALLPPLLETAYGYPVVDTGVILSARGVGVLLTMAIAGRLVGRFDARFIVATGFFIAAISLWMMTGWSLEQDWRPIVLSGFVQGLGLGFVFVPLNLLAFGTLPPRYRKEGAALMNLSRNIGSSIGIAIVTMLLARNIQISHAELAAHVTPYNLPVDPGLASMFADQGDAAFLMLDGIVNKQAAMIAYIDDFLFMAISCVVLIPFTLLLRKPRGKVDVVISE